MRRCASWAVATTVALTALAMVLNARSIERDLAGRSLAAMKAKLGDWADVSFDGRDATVTGVAPTPEAQAEVAPVVEEVWGVRTVDGRAGVLPLEAPYRLTIEKTDDGAILSGFAPDAATRGQLVEAVKSMLPKPDVADRLALARGAPADLARMAGFAAGKLAELRAGTATLSDGALDLAGQAPSFDAYDRLIQTLKGPLPTGLRLGAVEIRPPALSPFVFEASRSEAGRIRLAGAAPDEATRAALAGAAGWLVGAGNIENTLRVAGGAPEGFAAAARFAINQLGRLKSGAARLSDGEFSLAGAARDAGTKAAVEQAVNGARPNGLKLGALRIEVPPAAAGATPAPAALDGPSRFSLAQSGRTVALDGVVPDAEAHDRLIEQARALYGSVDVEDRLSLAKGASPRLPELALALMQAASRLVDGRASLADGRAEIKGAALTQTALADIRAKLERAFPAGSIDLGGLALAGGQPKVAAAECQKLMLEALSRNSIRFDAGKATIQQASFGLLDALSAAALRCPETKIEVSGHTDSDGPDAVNRPLSRARAEAVTSYLISAGVDRPRLSAHGFAADRPVAPNDTAENKARNRRIEFAVVAE